MPLLGTVASAISGNLDSNLVFPIGFSVLGSTASSITISSIPSTYRHLRIYVQLRSTRSNAKDGVYLRFNSDSNLKYSYTGLYGSPSTVSYDTAQSQSAGWVIECGAATYSGLRGYARIDVYEYANTSIAKSYNVLGGVDTGPNTAGGNISAYAGAWNDTSAITSVTILPSTGPNFQSDSLVAVYGIK